MTPRTMRLLLIFIIKMLWKSRGAVRNLLAELFDLLPDSSELPAIEMKQKQPAISSSWRTLWEYF